VPIGQVVLNITVVGTKHQGDIRVVQHVLEQAGEATPGHHLKSVGEIPIVVIGAGRNACGD
jgi:hypothetical protein